jgi:hypothetical protein
MEQLLSRVAAIRTRSDFIARPAGRRNPARTRTTSTARRNLQALCYLLSTTPSCVRPARGLDHAGAERIATPSCTPPPASCRIPASSPKVFAASATSSCPRCSTPVCCAASCAPFDRPSDRHWVVGVGEDAWLQLIEALRFDEAPASETCRIAGGTAALAARAVVLDRRLRHGTGTAAAGTVARDLRIALRRAEPGDDGLHRGLPGNWGKPVRADSDDRTCVFCSASARR